MLEAMLATDDYTHYSIDEHPVRPARGEVWPRAWRPDPHLRRPPVPVAPTEGPASAWPTRIRTPRSRTSCAPGPRVMADWFAAHPDRDALKRDLETAPAGLG